MPAPTTMHGAGGEWRVEEPRLRWDILDAFRDAAAELGIPQDRRLQPRRQRGLRLLPRQPAPRRALDHGEGLPAPGAARAPTCASSPTRRRRALALEGGRAIGVDFRPRRAPPTPRRRREVVLARRRDRLAPAAAAVGIGPARPARRARHRRRCTSCRASARTCRTTCSSALIYQGRGHAARSTSRRAACSARPGMGLDYFLFRRGPLTMAPSQLGAFAKSDPARATPNLEYHVQPLSLDRFGEPLHSFPGLHRLGLQPAPGEPRHGPAQRSRDPHARRRSGPTTSRRRATAASPPTRSA